MATILAAITPLKAAWDVFLLFAIPIGGGIPAGVVLARTRGIAWPAMMAIYFVSDVALACVFEPLMLSAIKAGKSSPFWAKLNESLKQSTKLTLKGFGTRMGPLRLIVISFGVDPMTGRVAAKASGHGFITGWLIAITGDMFYFAMIMGSTLWLNSVLNETWTTIIMMALMFLVPELIRKIRRPPVSVNDQPAG